MPLRVVGHAGRRTTLLQAKLADERRFGLGAGISLLAPLAVQTALEQAQRSLQPAHVDLCARFSVRGRKRPLGFCNGYASVDGALIDLGEAGALVESFSLPTLPLARGRADRTGAAGHAERRDRRRDAATRHGAPRRARPRARCGCAGTAAAPCARSRVPLRVPRDSPGACARS